MDDHDLVFRDPIDLPEHLGGFVGLCHKQGGAGGDLLQHLPLRGAWLMQNGVEGGDHGFPHVGQKLEDVASLIPAEDPVFVLEGDHIDGGEIDELRRVQIVLFPVVPDLKAHLRGIIQGGGTPVHGDHMEVALGLIRQHVSVQLVQGV